MWNSIDKLAAYATKLAGRPEAFVAAFALVVVWAALGPVFDYSDTWQLYANTATTLVTFLMVFLLQATQNRDAAAIQAKLDELIRAGAARNEFIGLDQKPADVIEAFRDELRKDPLRGWWHW